jgi:hypothetical protein
MITDQFKELNRDPLQGLLEGFRPLQPKAVRISDPNTGKESC